MNALSPEPAGKTRRGRCWVFEVPVAAKEQNGGWGCEKTSWAVLPVAKVRGDRAKPKLLSISKSFNKTGGGEKATEARTKPWAKGS